MGLTLIEAAKRETGDVYRRGIIEMFARSSDIMAAIPFTDIQGNAYHYNLEQALPGIGFRGVNEGFTASTGVLNPKTESLSIAGGDLDVDRFIVSTMGADQRTAQEALKIKALADAWTTKFVKGDSSTAPKEFDGLQTRLVGTQLVDNGATSGGDALSLAKLDELIDAVYQPTHLIMSLALRRRLTGAMRATSVSGNLDWLPSNFGQRVLTYQGLPILTGYQAGLSTAILAFEEAGSGGGTTSTSVYCVNFSDGGVVGLQNGGMDVRDMGELQTAPVYRTRVEWYVTIAVLHGRAAARLRGVKDAAVVV